jgi:hypothetical protein
MNMKSTLILTTLLASLSLAQAQERLPREEALKYAFIACVDLKQMQSTPIPTDPDVKRPVSVRDEDYGAMLLPESKLTADTLAKAGQEVTPIGQLWLHKLAPLFDGRVVPQTKLQLVTLSREGQSATVVLCALGVRKDANNNLELLLYGKDKEPVMRVPLKSLSKPQEHPLDLAAERRDDGGLLTLRILGQYEADFMVTDPERY